MNNPENNKNGSREAHSAVGDKESSREAAKNLARHSRNQMENAGFLTEGRKGREDGIHCLCELCDLGVEKSCLENKKSVDSSTKALIPENSCSLSNAPLRAFAPSRETNPADEDQESSREAAKDAKNTDGTSMSEPFPLRAFAPSRETNRADEDKESSREAAKNTKNPNSETPVPSREILNLEELSAIVVDCAYKLHVEAGPGLLESVYEVVLAKMLEERGLKVKRQVPVPIHLMGMKFDEGFRADILVEDVLLIELKSVEHLAPVHSKQTLTYLRLMNLRLGLLINFGAATFKEGIKRIVNQHQDCAASRLRANQKDGRV